VKLFNPAGVGTWLLTSFDPETNRARAWADLGDPTMAEYGDVSLEEMADFHGRFGIGIEIDNWFHPKPVSLAKEELYGTPATRSS
jgi:hypothetical protein